MTLGPFLTRRALLPFLRTFEPWAQVEREALPSHWVVRISARSAAAERRVAGELANFALGLTARDGRASS